MAMLNDDVNQLERFRVVSEQYREANFKAIRLSSVYIPIIRIFIALGFAATLLIGAYWVLFQPERFTVGSLAFFAMMIQRLLWPITRLGSVFDEYERARASARRIFGLLDAPNQIKDLSNAQSLEDGIGTVEFQQVFFEYKPGVPVISGLNLSIQKGQTIGFAGPTGGGKTTVIKLLLRLYDVSGGSICLDVSD